MSFNHFYLSINSLPIYHLYINLLPFPLFSILNYNSPPLLSLPTAYLAPISYYVALAHADAAQIDQHQHYVKQTWRNRCRIAMPQGAQDLVIPVCAAPPHTPVKDIRISDHGDWQHHHWSALQTAYGKSPFFEYYADDFAPFYQTRHHHFLIDFNQELHLLISSLIDLSTPIHLADHFLDATFPFAASPSPYYQVFAQRNGFLPDLSIIDLLFNLGPESILYLSKSTHEITINQIINSSQTDSIPSNPQV